MKGTKFMRRVVMLKPQGRFSQQQDVAPLAGSQVTWYPLDFWEEDPSLRTFDVKPEDSHIDAYRKQKFTDKQVMEETKKHPDYYPFMKSLHWITPDNDTRNWKSPYPASVTEDLNVVFRPENQNVVLRYGAEMPMMQYHPSDISHEVDYESEDADLELVEPRELMHNRTISSWWTRWLQWFFWGNFCYFGLSWIYVKMHDITMFRNAEQAPNFDVMDLDHMAFLASPEGRKLVKLGLLPESFVDIDEKGNRVSEFF